jgi:hypothetical protein
MHYKTPDISLPFAQINTPSMYGSSFQCKNSHFVKFDCNFRVFYHKANQQSRRHHYSMSRSPYQPTSFTVLNQLERCISPKASLTVNVYKTFMMDLNDDEIVVAVVSRAWHANVQQVQPSQESWP